MGHGGGCLGVGPRCRQTLLGVLRIVVGVNEVVQSPWMVRLVGIHLLKEFRRLPLLLKSLGSLRDSTKDRQSIKQCRFVIGIFSIDSRHRVTVMLVALRLGFCTGILIEGGDRSEI